VGQNKDKTRFCVDEEEFKTNPKSQQLWQKMKQDPKTDRLSNLYVPGSWGGETQPADPPKIYFEAFLKDGAVKCLPYKNYNF
jgi:hypothetical protein